ncbi:hypothetical protein, partial [Paracoccus spongiarum]
DFLWLKESMEDKDEESIEAKDLVRFQEVYMAEVHELLSKSVGAYVTDFGDLERVLLESANPLAVAAIAQELEWRNDRVWDVKSTTEARSRAWLNPLPESSLERAYVWAVLDVFYGDSAVDRDRAAMIARADVIANQTSDEDLDTPNTRIAEKIRSGELATKDDLLAVIRSEKTGVFKRFKAAQRIYEELKVRNRNTA